MTESESTHSDINHAIQHGDRVKFDALIGEFIPIGVGYIMSQFKTSHQDAYDCTMLVIERLLERFDELNNKEEIVFGAYFIQSLKHEFYSLQRKKKQDYIIESEVSASIRIEEDLNPIYEAITTEDERSRLEHCLRKLSTRNFRVIRWFFDNPDGNIQELVDEIGGTATSIYTRKHRIINILADCVKKNDIF